MTFSEIEKCSKHLPAARVSCISLVFSNARRVLSQCNIWLRLLYLLNEQLKMHYRGTKKTLKIIRAKRFEKN